MLNRTQVANWSTKKMCSVGLQTFVATMQSLTTYRGATANDTQICVVDGSRNPSYLCRRGPGGAQDPSKSIGSLFHGIQRWHEKASESMTTFSIGTETGTNIGVYMSHELVGRYS